MVLRPREGGPRWGKFWLCLTTAIADSVHLWGDCGGRPVFASKFSVQSVLVDTTVDVDPVRMHVVVSVVY